MRRAMTAAPAPRTPAIPAETRSAGLVVLAEAAEDVAGLVGVALGVVTGLD